MSQPSGNPSFVRYVIICGLENSSGLEVDEAANHGRSGSHVNPLEKSYQPRILRHYPDMTTWSHFNPEAVSRLVLPQGLRFCTDKEKGEPHCHPFVVTKEDGERSFGVSIVFYEKVVDINICHALHTLQKMYHTENANPRAAAAAAGDGGTGGGGGDTMGRERERPRSARVNTERSRSLPRHYQQARLSSSTLDLSTATYDYDKDTLYVTKSVSLILSEPLVSTAEHILVTMHKYVNKSDFDVQVLEGLLVNLLHDIPLPSPGRSVRFWCLGEVISFSMPKVPLELPLFDYDLLQFFAILGVENAIKLWVCVLLENQILVYSSDFDKLMLVCESITSLVYPFAWPHVYVPLLPPSLENFLDAPVPYIMGLLRRTHDQELYKRGTVCIVDIDNGELELPEELPEFPCEQELRGEIENAIVQFGGHEGANLLKEHAIEERDNLESSINQNMIPPKKTSRSHSHHGLLDDDNSDTMAQLNMIISKFETLSQQAPVRKSRSGGGARSNDTERLRLNNAVREVFVNRFAHLFLSYHHFVIVPDHQDDLNMTPQSQQDSHQNFDKISFLSDQVQAHLPFLARFLETQMFTVFIDQTAERMSDNTAQEDTPFDVRMRALHEQFGECLVRTPTYKEALNINVTNEILETRLKKVELTVAPQKVKPENPPSSGTEGALSETDSGLGSLQNNSICGIFPLLDPSKFNGPSTRGKRGSRRSANLVKGDRRSMSIDTTTLTAPTQKIPMLNPSPASIAETHWKFVNQLLMECKQKTKRILLDKLGQEAVEWGHVGNSAPNVTGSEENMLVASICDLIERIWSHGLRSRHRKSAFWHYLFKYGGRNDERMRFKGKLGNQAFCMPLLTRSKPYILPDHSRPIQVIADPCITDIDFDSTIMAVMHNVSTVHEIKTEIGYARAWIRLALERKVLSQYLHVMLCDESFLKTLYRRYAFVRCEDEREQSLFHLQTLNTVDFSCFTNAYPKSSILYQVVIFSSQKTPLTSSNVWLQVVGSNGETPYLFIPRGVLHFSFWATNLGIITSLRVGHDNAGNNPNWLVEHVLVRNEFTGHIFKFVCGRWLGQSIDDGSTERYMVGYPVPGPKLEEETVTSHLGKLVEECSQPPVESTCPAMQLKSTGARDPDAAEITAAEVVELQTMLGDAINRIVKFYHKSLNEKISYAHLMCGKFGLVHALIYIFSYGYKSARLFGKNLSVWDFFLKVTMDFNQSLQHLLSNTSQPSPTGSPVKRSGGMSSVTNTLESPRMVRRRLSGSGNQVTTGLANLLLDSPRKIPQGSGVATLSRANQFRRMYTRLITRIETGCHRLGKDDKFQLFICLAVHDKLLGRIVTDLTKAVAAQHLYEEHAFLRDPSLTSFLSHILEALEDISVPVDPALKATLEKHHLGSGGNHR